MVFCGVGSWAVRWARRLALYRNKRAPQRSGEPFDPAELLARMLMHVPAPRLHLARYYGHYAHVSRAQRRRTPADARTEGEPALEESALDV